MTNELKPCPFCGGEAKLHGKSFFFVACNNDLCSASTNVTNARTESINAWNTRQPAFDWKPIKELEELIEVVLLDKSKAYSVGIRLGKMVRVSSLNNSSQEFYCDIPVNYFTHYALLTPPERR